MKAYHVLVLAMSDLRDPIVRRKNGEEAVSENIYRYGSETEKEYRGIGQLEVIPRFIADHYDTEITHYIILETPETTKKLDHDFQKFNTLCPEKIDLEPGEKLSAVEFFRRRVTSFGLSGDVPPVFIDVPLDIEHPENGIQEVLDHIRSLYQNCMDEQGDWKLWLDTHGGFREISMAMFSLMQVLSATAIDGVPKIADGQKIIEVDGVYTVRFNAVASCQIIKDLTKFYRLFTLPVFKAYMNYGQYFLDVIAPDESGKPYAFVSYRSSDAEKERYMILAMLKKAELLYWYDDGIHLYDDWAETLERKNEGCTVFIALLSRDYFSSPQCLKELRKAIAMQKPIIFISLDDTLPYISGDVADPDHPDTILFTKEEMEALSHRQQVYMYRKYVKNDVLQEHHLLSELMRETGFLHRIHDSGEDAGGQYDGDPVFVNCTNHPSQKWSREQYSAAAEMGRVVDVAFPNVDPYATAEDVQKLADETVQKILQERPAAVLCQGEFTLTYAIAAKLHEAGIDTYAACSERNVIEETDEQGNTVKKTIFAFAGFRKYIS
ncbi:MAG: toll/interleukin-1 receptor domain-containing protein [Solobacterium sp.]|nr:toll/interleukin-1 receptor domain-containing protein [Solobacterium sp.]